MRMAGRDARLQSTRMLAAATTFAHASRSALSRARDLGADDADGRRIHGAQSLDDIGSLSAACTSRSRSAAIGSGIPAGASITL